MSEGAPLKLSGRERMARSRGVSGIWNTHLFAKHSGVVSATITIVEKAVDLIIGRGENLADRVEAIDLEGTQAERTGGRQRKPCRCLSLCFGGARRGIIGATRPSLNE